MIPAIAILKLQRCTPALAVGDSSWKDNDTQGKFRYVYRAGDRQFFTKKVITIMDMELALYSYQNPRTPAYLVS